MTRISPRTALSFLSGKRDASSEDDHPKTIELTSSAFKDGEAIPSKYTEDGETLWTSRFECAPNSYNEATAIAVDTAENVFLTGYGYSSARNADCFTVKFDRNGAEQ